MEPDPAAQLMTVIDAVAARAEEARLRLDDLSARLDALDGSRATAPRPLDPADPVRLAAIELAVSGADRAATAAHLRRDFPAAPDLGAVLDDVFGGNEGTVP